MNIVRNINNDACRFNTPGGMLLAAYMYESYESVAEEAIFVTARDGHDQK